LTPYIEREVTADLRYGLRSDNVKTQDDGSDLIGSSAAGYFGFHRIYAEQDPVPFGWRLEAERSETRYDNSVQEPLVLDLARASLNYAIGPDLAVGLRAGYERNTLVAGLEQSGSIYGAQMRWSPSERTQLSAFAEERFFGHSWRVAFDHRMPWLAFNTSFSRAIESAPQLLFELPAGSNVSALLDQMLTTRIPDPVERARAVQELINNRGLPNATNSPTSIYTQRLSVVTANNVSIGYLGRRSTITLSGYQWLTEDLTPSTTLPTDTTLNNNKQYGVALVLSHRFTPATTALLSMDYSRIRALEGVGNDNTKQAEARLRFTVQAGRETAGFFGARYRKLASNVITSGDETAVFMGLDHTF
jgi:uncharacterized protein (PEP-CTERM system associated)